MSKKKEESCMSNLSLEEASLHLRGLTMTDLDELAYSNALSFQGLKDNLVRIRIDSGLSQADVANLLGVSQEAIASIEEEGSDPRLATLRAYALAVGAKVTISVKTAS